MRMVRKARAGFTLVELLVAMALTMFIMILLAGAFQQAIDIFRTLRAQAVLSNKIRNALDVMRTDLAADHFDQPTAANNGTGGPHVSDQHMDFAKWKPVDYQSAPNVPVNGGFFRLWQGYDPTLGGPNTTITEGLDGDTLWSTRATTHVLHFTTRWGGTRPGDYFTAKAPLDFFDNPANPVNPGVDSLSAYSDPTPSVQLYASKWAEVAYFLVPAGRTTPGAGAESLQLYSLRRRVRIVAHSQTSGAPAQTTLGPVSQYPAISQNGDFIPTQFNRLQDLAVPINRMGAQQPAAPQSPGIYTSFGGVYRPPTWGQTANSNALVGDDILLTDVISFEVKATGTAYPGHPGIGIWPNPASPDYPFDDLPQQGLNTQLNQVGRVFDTWATNGFPPQNWDDTTVLQFLQSSPTQVPLRIRLKALQIHLRVWDIKTQQTRQATLIQEI
jgi:type II secretory pathway pseudopilin PulG